MKIPSRANCSPTCSDVLYGFNSCCRRRGYLVPLSRFVSCFTFHTVAIIAIPEGFMAFLATPAMMSYSLYLKLPQYLALFHALDCISSKNHRSNVFTTHTSACHTFVFILSICLTDCPHTTAVAFLVHFGVSTQLFLLPRYLLRILPRIET